MRLLIIDDDTELCQLVADYLKPMGFEVEMEHDGEHGADRATSEPWAAIILDVMMPGLNGYEVCKQIRRQDEKVPILFLTAKAEEIDTVLGLELGADDYMTKPFGVKEIIARIRAILRRTASRGGGRTDDDFTMDDLRIVPTELRAYRDKVELALSPRDVKVLRLLYDRRGKVIDRNTLADEVWGVDYFPESRALDQHISQLRKRIEKDPAQPRIIRTVHGAGYRFE